MLSRRLLVFLTKQNESGKAQLLNHLKSFKNVRCVSTSKKPHQSDMVQAPSPVDYIVTDYSNKVIFGSKDTSELIRAFFILTASSIDWFVTYSDKILLRTRKILWQPIFDSLLKKTFYGQFAAGTCIETSGNVVNRLQKTGIRSMMMVPIESVDYKTQEEEEAGLQKNFDIIVDCIHGEAILENHGFSQVKLTALCNKKLLLEMNKDLIAFETNHKEPGVWNLKEMSKYLINEDYEGIQVPTLDNSMNHKFQELVRKLDKLAELCRSNNVRMMIDAEQTYIQAALGYLVLLLQSKYNNEEIVVYNTYQCFRKDTLSRIKADHALGEQLGFKIAGKLVRGAYMLEERRLAKENNYPDPINDTFEDTTASYHSCVDYLLPLISRNEAAIMVASHNENTVDFVINSNNYPDPINDTFEDTTASYHACVDYLLPLINRDEAAIMVASHNENTVDFVINRMKEYNLPKTSDNLCFGQIYGMCDHVSYHLAGEGYRPFKSVPYGAIDDTLLYLTRRAQENRSVMERTKLERQMIRKELMRRSNIFNKEK